MIMNELSGNRSLSLLSAQIICTIMFALSFTTHADEQDVAALLEDRGCYACHSLSETLIGPPYQAIAKLHHARRDVMINILARKIIIGGAGNWGLVPMVPNEHVTEDEAHKMAEWILNQHMTK